MGVKNQLNQNQSRQRKTSQNNKRATHNTTSTNDGEVETYNTDVLGKNIPTYGQKAYTFVLNRKR